MQEIPQRQLMLNQFMIDKFKNISNVSKIWRRQCKIYYMQNVRASYIYKYVCIGILNIAIIHDYEKSLYT